MAITAEAAKAQGKNLQLDSIIPNSFGRRILLCSIQGCEPCNFLKAALSEALDENQHECFFTSLYKYGDLPLRSLHLRMGAKNYPTIILIEDNNIVATVKGYAETDGAIVVNRYVDFLETGKLPPEL